jgi:hypothetical protein
MHAGVYAGVLHYLKAVEKVGSPLDGRAVVATMKGMPTEETLFGGGTIREDGRKIHPMYLLEVKTPSESKNEWDVFKVSGTIEPDHVSPAQRGRLSADRQELKSRATAAASSVAERTRFALFGGPLPAAPPEVNELFTVKSKSRLRGPEDRALTQFVNTPAP